MGFEEELVGEGVEEEELLSVAVVVVVDEWLL